MLIILGAGLTGLSAAYTLAHSDDANGGFDEEVCVLEKDGVIGGASRTVEHNGFKFDLGGHRFYTKKMEIRDLVIRLMGDEICEVDRVSRILLKGKFFDYPLSAFNALCGLGPLAAARIMLDYAKINITSRLKASPDQTFEDWVINRFGVSLYDLYFRDYSEKVWGISCNQLSADFAEQRIKGLSFKEAVKEAILKWNPLAGRAGDKGGPATLITRFLYPKEGFGRIPGKMAESLRPSDVIKTRSELLRIEHDSGEIRSVTFRRDGAIETHQCSHIISTIPVTNFLNLLDPAPPKGVCEAAASLKFRGVVIVFLALSIERVTTDTWLYFPEKDIYFGRIHEPKNWSKSLAPEDKTSLVVECFASKNDATWNSSDDSIVRRVAADLVKIGFIRQEDLLDFKVIRLGEAYPIYRLGYGEALREILPYLRRFKNLQCAGRNGVFRYTSGDHCIDMGVKAARNVLGEEHDITSIGAEQEYAEAEAAARSNVAPRRTEERH